MVYVFSAKFLLTLNPSLRHNVFMITDRDLKFIRKAFDLAQDISPVAGSRVIAILTIKNRIISVGMNQNRTHPFQAKYSKNSKAIFLHAENCAINLVKDLDLSKATLYVARAKRFYVASPFILGLAKPCEGCQKSIKRFGIKRIIYTIEKGVQEL
jgi:deoxycytidylate deaminase